MRKANVIRASEVKTLFVDETYASKMLIDRTNSDTHNTQINMGIVAPGASHPDHNHPTDYDEFYLVIKGQGMVRLDGQEYDLLPGDVAFIPGGSYHAIANKSDTEELVIFTVWPKHPEEGANPVYDQRIREWGKSYVTIHDSI
ncbi:dimethylsulfonioproprionate lyase family protein [Cohnella ginsengisoli]|uniref:Dimethylsulfonioproprionate lyase family protein n=1 Tax=Cohnella ginsengisoli TaxID=425004 RepID=A0A9X4KKF1_9BACL|nr:dimethylsulfonioproprionate lyase family protein [Cohnella ginsengisoli]MDG0793889.1 dimethylsulfonioproprionate lyase family protein [Cohnella ginsengisoli]